MKYKKVAAEHPFAKVKAESAKLASTVVSGSNDLFGANSIETFPTATGLTYTHEDADGFLEYPTSFPGRAANYWFKDAGVKVWAYEETFDNWQDTFGMDAVMVFYHSGHGNMDSNGVFQAPLGGKWDNRDWAFSNNMAFGNEDLRYLFWSTCLSLRVSGQDSPVRTWYGPNKGGLRMMFGYETISIDDPHYGKYFWEEWRLGKTFARAFLDASWRISHDQVPVVMAAGASANEAIDRLNTERFFSQAPVGKAWYKWQYIGTLPTRSFANRTAVPKQLTNLILSNKFADDKSLGKIANAAGIAKAKAETILLSTHGNRMVSSKDVQLNVNSEGTLNLLFGGANSSNPSLLDEKKAIAIAQSLIQDLDLNKGIELKLGNIRHRFTCGGTLKGSGVLETPSAIETIVQFRQAHNGIESVNSGHGLIAVSVDNDGRVVNVHDSTKTVLGETGKRTSKTSSPRDPHGETDLSVESQFSRKVDKLTAGSDGKSSTIREVTGYDFSGNLGTVVHQKDIEIEFANHFRKRYKVRIPLI